jgi:hypothetical protein
VSTLIRAAACLVGMACVGGCDSSAAPAIELLTHAEWNESPPSLDKIGYQVSVDFGWPSRHDTCFPMPSHLTVSMNERTVTPTQLGDCVWDILVTFDAVPPGPVHVSVSSDGYVYGDADFDNLFPGAGAQLAVPGDGTVLAGSQFTVSLPPTVMPVATNLGYGEFYWLDTPSSGVPYYTFAPGMDGPEPQTVVMTAPTITGHASLVVKSVFGGDFGPAASCTGFDSCTAWPSSQAAGPIDVVVVP